MSLLQLASGRFLVLDTIGLVPPVKAWLDDLTDQGDKIEAVIATHPFHTLYFPAFHKAYPKVRETRLGSVDRSARRPYIHTASLCLLAGIHTHRGLHGAWLGRVGKAPILHGFTNGAKWARRRAARGGCGPWGSLTLHVDTLKACMSVLCWGWCQPPYFGTPRHLRNQKDIPWAGSVRDVLTKW